MASLVGGGMACNRHVLSLGLIFTMLLAVTGCASDPLMLNIVSAPEALNHGKLNSTSDTKPISDLPGGGMLYATDRAPVGSSETGFYGGVRSQALRVGLAKLEVGDSDLTWEQAREISILKNKAANYPLRVTGVEEFGALDRRTPLTEDGVSDVAGAARARFAKAINERLEQSSQKDVFIYVHGYKVVFENPVLVSSELWHFLGYEGAFIAFSWPSTPKSTAYFGDIDAAAGMARNLRELIEFVETSTKAERIHILGYSAGTRMVARAMEQISLINRGREADPKRLGHKLENVMLVSSDIDRDVFSAYLADGILGSQRHLIIYGSQRDQALQISGLVTGHKRLGSTMTSSELTPAFRRLLTDNKDRISYINVSNAEDITLDNGHGYFRSSPWVSGDILMKLAYRLPPEERGLVRDPSTGILSFPPDYLQRMSAIQSASYAALCSNPSTTPAHAPKCKAKPLPTPSKK
jgi:esterase/lipase superfamily enzyme